MEIEELVTNLSVPDPHSDLQLRVHALEELGLVLLEVLQRSLQPIHLLFLGFVHHVDDGLMLDVLRGLHAETLCYCLGGGWPAILRHW